jgi:hypothetical protein
MNDVEKVNLRKTGAWLSGDIDIRLPKWWLAIGAVCVVVLLILALD